MGAIENGVCISIIKVHFPQNTDKGSAWYFDKICVLGDRNVQKTVKGRINIIYVV